MTKATTKTTFRMNGWIYTYNESMTSNWTSMIKKGAIMTLTDVPEVLYKRDKDATTKWGDKLFTVEILKDTAVNREKLEAEKADLLARIAEIDRILAQ